MTKLKDFLKDTLYLNLAALAQGMDWKHRNQMTYRLNGTVPWTKDEKVKLAKLIGYRVKDIPFPEDD